MHLSGLYQTGRLAFPALHQPAQPGIEAFSRAAIRLARPLTARATSTMSETGLVKDLEYPGTATTRLANVVARARALSVDDLSMAWPEVRRKLLEAGGLKDLPRAKPGMGYTGHAFNDWNHCDLTTMSGATSHNLNDGAVAGIAMGNALGRGIQIASMPELGPGGSWSTCIMGCHHEPPNDVAHIQFKSRIAFKLVWCPPEYSSFVLVDDAGELLASGTPTGQLPALIERKENFCATGDGRYSTAAKGLRQKPAL